MTRFWSAVTRHRLVVLLAAVFVFPLACSSTKPVAIGPLRQQALRSQQNGNEAYQRRAWAAAAADFDRAAQQFAALNDDAAEATSRHNQAESLRCAGQLVAACAVFEQAIALNQRLGRKLDEARALAGQARCFTPPGGPDAAVKQLERALPLANESKSLTATLQNDLALALLDRNGAGDHARAVTLLNAALQTNLSLKNAPAIAVNHLNLGRADLTVSPARALTDLTQALDEFRALDDPLGLARAHELLAQLYAARPDAERAKFHRERARAAYAQLKDEAALRRLDAPQ